MGSRFTFALLLTAVAFGQAPESPHAELQPRAWLSLPAPPSLVKWAQNLPGADLRYRDGLESKELWTDNFFISVTPL
jgi:hypothetical protein